MKTMKWIAAMMLAVVISASAYAQQRHEGKGKGGQRAEMMKKRFDDFSQKLGLRDDQKEKVKVIAKEQFEQMKAIRQDKDKTPEAKRDAMKTIVKDTDTKIQGVLDTDQKTKYAKLKEERKAEVKKKQAERKKMKEVDNEIESELIF